ncbi:MAG: sugar ABC transporter permease [Sphaerochaetaceae bacterium]|nr:sugar ABC transporter permease [Sphaerochaetaceae bacterium]MDC7236269.1 sugar ABC transporter permease [Sphaerochaetaceae bacterium]MDC7243456.1 sugar ABC transporter permease [Sphaerochaetaceae bacterium]MDC7250287.1 sugar ABC transporter permease [Sphaerochaetaceae bacterium]
MQEKTLLKKGKLKKRSSVSYSHWGYFFILPFFIIYIIFSLIPLLSTFYYSFFENYRIGLTEVGPNFVGWANYKKVIFETEVPRFAINTFVIWIIGFIPQIMFALLLAVWFTSNRLSLKGQQFFKTVIYMPNLIMASAFAMLFFTLFSDAGPVNQILVSLNFADKPIRFLTQTITTRGLIAIMNFLMWFGNTTLLLMAGIMGIDQSLFDAAYIDGASSSKTFFKVTLPLLKPIFVYTLMTSMIGGIQMFDVPQILTNGKGTPDRTSETLIMYLNNHLTSKNYGMAGALSVLIFIVTAFFGIFVYKTLMKENSIIGGKN